MDTHTIGILIGIHVQVQPQVYQSVIFTTVAVIIDIHLV